MRQINHQKMGHLNIQFTEGGAELLAENLSTMVEHARPRDWLAARIKQVETRLPWTIRIHDVGDFHSIGYVKAWIAVVQKFPQCSFWFYTRSFLEQKMLDILTGLAQLENCQGWLSIDSDNYTQGILAKCKTPADVWKIALLQDKDLFPEVIPAIDVVAKTGEVVNFPYHRGGHHVVPRRDSVLMTCPAVTGSYKLKSSREVLRPCQQCTFCLP
jgi:hypothetical protein